jgi:hypothetical protein
MPVSKTAFTLLTVALDDANITTYLNREEAQLLKRGHHGCGGLACALRPDPERTFVASDRMTQIDGYCSLMGQGRETLLGFDALGMPVFSARSFGA